MGPVLADHPAGATGSGHQSRSGGRQAHVRRDDGHEEDRHRRDRGGTARPSSLLARGGIPARRAISAEPVNRRSERAMLPTMMTALALGAVAACTPKGESMNDSRPVEFATRYTAAWCSHDASSVA